MPTEEVMEQTTSSIADALVLTVAPVEQLSTSSSQFVGRYARNAVETAAMVLTKDYKYTVVPRDRLRAIGQFTTFREQAIELSELLTSMTTERAAFVLTITELLNADNPEQYRHLINIAEFAGTTNNHELAIARDFLDALTAQLTLRARLDATLADVVSGATTLAYSDAVMVLETLGATSASLLALSMTRTDTIRAAERLLTAVPVEIVDALESADAATFEDAIRVLEALSADTAHALALSMSQMESTQIAEQLRAAIPAELVELLAGGDSLSYQMAMNVLESVAGTTPHLLRFAMDRADTVRAATRMLAAIPAELLDLLSGADALSLRDVLQTIERIQAADSTQAAVAASLILGLLARVTDRGTLAEKTADALVADTTLGYQLTLLAQMLDTVSAATQTQQTLVLSIEEALDAQAADELQGLSHYLANLRDYANGWVGFRLGDEDFTGWVMNTEGDMPLSEYTNYEFNSFCRVGDVYLGAADAGLYLLDGATDAGEPIESAVRTMMLDFGSPAMKRVRHAYLGYTSDGSLMLKVRTVTNGELKEQWYEAQELPAQAPREQMIQLGRGLRSRYWQFELVNVDGADFELDMLELHPVYLNRRT